MSYQSKYDKTFPDQLISHMKAGYSFKAFAGRIGVTRKTLYDWLEDDDKKEFKEAYDVGKSACLLFWEQIGLSGTLGDSRIKGYNPKKFNATAWIFQMKNRFHYRNEPDGFDPDDPDPVESIVVDDNKEDSVKVTIHLPSNGRELKKESAEKVEKKDDKKEQK